MEGLNMTIQELYQNIDGDYDQALRVLRVEKLVDKHIRKFTQNGVVDGLLKAGESMNPVELFEAAHAMKGVCANLGLTGLSCVASEIAEEYRPGNPRKFSDEEIKARIETIRGMYSRTVEAVQSYEQSCE
jgi:HPt (histidine-containing phosphotransfer) domain-containing protein